MFFLCFLERERCRVPILDALGEVIKEEAYEILLDYLAKCVKYQDATAFSFEETQEEHYQTH